MSGRPRRQCAATVLAGLALAIGSLSGTGCATNPVTGEREVSFMSSEREAALGAQAAAQVEQQMGLVDDPALEGYVEQIGQRLAKYSPRKDVVYQFAVADMPEPNAFALPGGYIYVSRGLLAVSNSEDELACVIGHEIGHVAAKHAAQRETRAVGVGLLGILGTAVAAGTGGAEAAQAVSDFSQVAGAGFIASYGRDQERQSDQVGQQLAAKAGYDPHGMSHFMTTLGRETTLRAGGEKRRPSFFDSHPMSEERAQTTAARAKTLTVAPGAPIARDRDAYLQRLDGLLVGPAAAEGVFAGQRFLHPSMDFQIDFPSGWQTQNGKTAVAGQAPDQSAMLVLQAQGPTGDPQAAAQAFAKEAGMQLQGLGGSKVGGYAAYRARATAQSQQGPLAVDLTWIAHPAATFRVTGMATEARFGGHAKTFERSARSFARLSAAERRGISELRLRVVRARAGESLAQLSQRSGNAWTVPETAVANGMAEGVRLRAGEAIKIVQRVPFVRD